MIGDARPREVHNAVTGESVRFVRTADETGGELLVLETRWTKPNHATPPHTHPGMEERWQVLEGTVGFRIGDTETIAGPGDTVTAAPGELHNTWSTGPEPVLMRIEMRPALRWEDFIRQLFALASEGLEGDVAQRSVMELLGEFEPEIKISRGKDVE